MSQLAFCFFAAVVIIAAWRVVTTAEVARAAMALVIALAGLGPLFLLAGAEFIAVIQVLVYVGAVVVLFLFGIMLTQKPGDVADPDYKRRWPGVLVAAVLFAGLWAGITQAVRRTPLDVSEPTTTNEVGRLLLSDQIIAFEAVSILLLAALIGSIAIARKD